MKKRSCAQKKRNWNSLKEFHFQVTLVIFFWQRLLTSVKIVSSTVVNLTVQILSFLDGKVLEAFYKCPYSLHGVWTSFVHVQFRTRYCGHTLSRLADFCHNMTKQCTLPTVRRREPEKGDLSIACVLHFNATGGCKGWNIGKSHFSIQVCLCYFFKGLAGDFCTKSTAHFCLEMCWFGMYCLLFVGW